MNQSPALGVRIPSKYLSFIHVFRGFAILLIVGLHVLLSSLSDNVAAKRVLEVIFTNSTVLFVFIAGFLFYYLNRERFDYLDYLRKKLLYVVLPYILISIPIMVKKLYFDTNPEWWMDAGYKSLSNFEKVGYMLATGKQFGPFWFIPMIILFYLVSPLLIRFSRLSISSYLIPTLVVAGLFTVSWGDYSSIFFSFIHFLPVYLFGMWISSHYKLFISSGILLLALWLGYILMTYLEYASVIPFDQYLLLKESGEFHVILNLSKFKSLVFSIALLMTFYRLGHLTFPFLTLMGTYSFGLYFLHLYAINLFPFIVDKLGLPVSKSMGYFAACLVFVLLICSLIIFVIRKVLGKRSRMFIGS